ncbi:MAG: hypothetical protein HQL63_15970 [Magnetococcales bacterium]|nr:hypothetical protein [Magnetococcales bacterium]MBF0323004.1 hypothetical protein [Magnetococcales bacterium]
MTSPRDHLKATGKERGGQVFGQPLKKMALLLLLTLSSSPGCTTPVSWDHSPMAAHPGPTGTQSAQLRMAFDKIVPHQTSTEDLKTLGFDPATSANIRVLNWMEVAQYFHVDLKNHAGQEMADPGIRYCIHSKKYCHGYLISIADDKQSHAGRPLSNSANAERQSDSAGINHMASILIKNDLVIFKKWDGLPNPQRITPVQPPVVKSGQPDGQQKPPAAVSRTAAKVDKQEQPTKSSGTARPPAQKKSGHHGNKTLPLPTRDTLPILQKEILDWN